MVIQRQRSEVRILDFELSLELLRNGIIISPYYKSRDGTESLRECLLTPVQDFEAKMESSVNWIGSVRQLEACLIAETGFLLLYDGLSIGYSNLLQRPNTILFSHTLNAFRKTDRLLDFQLLLMAVSERSNTKISSFSSVANAFGLKQLVRNLWELSELQIAAYLKVVERLKKPNKWGHILASTTVGGRYQLGRKHGWEF
jgi:hypothetical protein